MISKIIGIFPIQKIDKIGINDFKLTEMVCEFCSKKMLINKIRFYEQFNKWLCIKCKNKLENNINYSKENK